MPHFTTTLQQGQPIVNMFVGVSVARAQALATANQTVPPIQTVRALVDTGASGTCIDPLVFAALQLQPTGMTPMLTPSTGNTPVDTETYDVSIIIPGAVTAGVQDPPLVMQNIPVSASHLFVAQGFHVLLGRDILRRCILHYNGAVGLFTISY